MKWLEKNFFEMFLKYFKGYQIVKMSFYKLKVFFFFKYNKLCLRGLKKGEQTRVDIEVCRNEQAWYKLISIYIYVYV